MTISFDDFMKVDIRVGQIVRAEPFPEARKPAFKLWVDFGPEIGEKKSSAQITRHYSVEELQGRKVLAVVNFPPRQIGPVMSEVLVLGVPDDAGEVVLLTPDKDGVADPQAGIGALAGAAVGLGLPVAADVKHLEGGERDPAIRLAVLHGEVADDAGEVVLLTPDKDVPIGGRMY